MNNEEPILVSVKTKKPPEKKKKKKTFAGKLIRIRILIYLHVRLLGFISTWQMKKLMKILRNLLHPIQITGDKILMSNISRNISIPQDLMCEIALHMNNEIGRENTRKKTTKKQILNFTAQFFPSVNFSINFYFNRHIRNVKCFLFFFLHSYYTENIIISLFFSHSNV